MKTASKPLRVPADIDECSPTPVRVLRNGKRVRATPRLPKASRVTLSPEDTKALDGADRVPLAQVLSLARKCHTQQRQICCVLQHAHPDERQSTLYALWVGHMLQPSNALLTGPTWTGATPGPACPKTGVTLVPWRVQGIVYSGWDRRGSSAQAQREPATPPTQPMPMQGRTPPASSDDQQLSIATPEGDASEDAPLTPATVISSMQQLQLAESMPESLLLCQESLAESSSGQARV